MIMPAQYSYDEDKRHVSVMSTEAIDFLALAKGKIIVDCTLGLGGHSLRILEAFSPSGKLIAIDRDQSSIEAADKRLKKIEGCYQLIHDDFKNIDQILSKLNISKIDGVIMDLGISSFQLDDPARGFSFRQEGPLDMRMDQQGFISAYDIVNTLTEKELSAIIKEFGEERYHNRIAKFVVENRKKHPIQTTKELSEIISRAVPGHGGRDRIHPATRSFQAIRIAVNRELESLKEAINKIISLLDINGRIVVISFHSLEDRIVKEKFKDMQQQGFLEILTKKPLRPTEKEENENPRARSARLRAAQRC